MNIKYKTIRRVRITAPMSERQEVFDWCDRNSYRMKRWEPKVVSFPKVDPTKLLVVAEKEIK